MTSAGLFALADVASPADAKSAKKKSKTSHDAELLNAAIALENEGIAAESGLLTPDVLKVGILSQSQHKQHRAALASAVTCLGGQPAGRA